MSKLYKKKLLVLRISLHQNFVFSNGFPSGQRGGQFSNGRNNGVPGMNVPPPTVGPGGNMMNSAAFIAALSSMMSQGGVHLSKYDFIAFYLLLFSL